MRKRCRTRAVESAMSLGRGFFSVNSSRIQMFPNSRESCVEQGLCPGQHIGDLGFLADAMFLEQHRPMTGGDGGRSVGRRSSTATLPSPVATSLEGWSAPI